MAGLEGYDAYGACAPTTGTISHALAYQGAIAPHTGQPYSEALLTGLSGGIAFGYFIFAYEGYDPQVNILTRNTFDAYGWDAIARRIGLVQDVANSTSADRAREKLVGTLEEGRVPIVWADVFSFGYERSDFGDRMWGMMPVIVAAYEAGGRALLDDRARVPIEVDASTLDAARAKVKKEKARLVVIDLPGEPDLEQAVRESIAQCIGVFTAKPPRGSANNFGFRAYDRWIAALRKPGSKDGWSKTMSPGRALFAGLTTAFTYALQFWEDDSRTADRAVYADFLEEAAEILGADELCGIADEFRASGRAWRELGERLLPEDVAVLRMARETLVHRHETFLASGNAQADEIERADDRLARLAGESREALADEALAARIMEGVADGVERIRDAERAAIDHLATVASV